MVGARALTRLTGVFKRFENLNAKLKLEAECRMAYARKFALLN